MLLVVIEILHREGIQLMKRIVLNRVTFWLGTLLVVLSLKVPTLIERVRVESRWEVEGQADLCSFVSCSPTHHSSIRNSLD